MAQEGIVCCYDQIIKRFMPCIHEGCTVAMCAWIDPERPIIEEKNIVPAGQRVKVSATGTILPRSLITPDGDGGVRSLKDRESCFSIGFAMTRSKKGAVWIYTRPLRCTNFEGMIVPRGPRPSPGIDLKYGHLAR